MSGASGEPGSVDLSVLVPTRDRAAYLADCLASLTAQQVRATMEIVVVDNGSRDHTSQVVADWARRDPRVRSLREERPGRSRALNAGLAVARGTLALCTDDDVVVAPGWAQAYLELLTGTDGVDALAGGRILSIPADLGPWPAWLDGHGSGFRALDHGGPSRALDTPQWLWGANMGMRRESLMALGGFDESLGVCGDQRGTYEDLELQQRARDAGYPVWYLPDAVVRHRVPRSRVTPGAVARQELHAALSASTHRPGSGPGRGRLRGAAALLAAVGGWCVAAVGVRTRPSRVGLRLALWAGRGAGARLGAIEARDDRSRWERSMAAACRRLSFAVAADAAH